MKRAISIFWLVASTVAWAIAFNVAVPVTVFGQSQLTQHTLKLAEGVSPAAAELNQFEWLVGRWVGEGLGGECEEVFLPPWNDTMFGTFRYAREGRLVFSEFFSLAKNDGGLVLKLKHFHPDFVGWEEKDAMVNFPLIRVEPNAAYFGGLTYRLEDDGTLMAWVAMQDRNGVYSEAEFVFKKVVENSNSESDKAEPATQSKINGAAENSRVKAIRKSVVVDCTREKAWSMWTTSEGVATFFSPDSKIELSPGGAYEMYFGLAADPTGLRGSEGSTVLTLIPQEMLIFEWTFPPNTPGLRQLKKKIPVKLTFQALSPNQTQVDLIHFGWEEGEEMEMGFKYFEQVWPYVLQAFKSAAEKN